MKLLSSYVRQWVRFGFGEAGGLDSPCYVNHLTNAFENADRGISSVLVGLTKTVHFLRRVGEAEEDDVPGASLVPSAEGQVIQDDPAQPPADLPIEVCGHRRPSGRRWRRRPST